ncbi:MAG TPA: glucose-6-phosphate isomerase [Actinomycetota bacterium]|nr:glucose-6-phosphate isomerase [Actinomycetota bacterium]
MAAVEIRTNLGELRHSVQERLARMAADDVVRRIWDRDHTVWRPDPREITDRLGWLDAVEWSRELLPGLRTLVEEVRAAGLTRTLLLGMGGSSLAPEVIRHTFYPHASPAFDVQVLDSTHPDAVVRTEGRLDRALLLVSSKSGTTIETRSHLAHFSEMIGDAGRVVAITDPGSALATDGMRLGFRSVVEAPPDVGGRFSALTVFGLLPAALCGVDPELLLIEAASMMSACRPGVPVEENPAAVLGAAMGEAALAGRDKLTIRADPGAAPLGAWLEQLVAESTGKDGRGILPVHAEPDSGGFGDDRLFLGIGKDPSETPSVTVPYRRSAELGALFFLFELATAVAGHVLDIHPFDQPDVQAAKDRTTDVLERGSGGAAPSGSLDELLETVHPGDYVAIQAFVDPTAEAWEELQRARGAIAKATGVATTLGFGPRYLHSTGQLHKGGPPTGVFVQVLDEATEDRKVPGRPFTFGELIAAQADGDMAALRERGRRAARVRRDDLVTWQA